MICLKSRKIRKSNTLVSIILFALITIDFIQLYNSDNSFVTAQQQNNTIPFRSDYPNTDTRSFKVSFDSLAINDDHDPVFSGEWVMNAYVNNRIIDLFPGSLSVNSGDVINLTENNSAIIEVPNENTSFIRVGILGWENDNKFEPLPVFFTLLDTRIPYYLYYGLVQHSTVPFISGPNDPNGFIAIQYDKQDNYGIGSHSICSERNIAATDPTGAFEGNCDYRINFTIESLKR